MGFLKSLFSGRIETAEEQQQNNQKRNFDILKFDGIKALRVRDMAQAERCFEAALAISDDLECRDYLSQAYINSGKLDLALDQLAILQREEPENLDILFRMIQVQFMQEDYAAMAETCARATEVDGDNAIIKYMFARAKNGLGQTEEALRLLDEATTASENLIDARLMRGDILLREGRAAEAETEADWLLARQGDHEEALLLKARALRDRGQTDEALRHYGQVIDANPFSAVAYEERSALRRQAGDTAGADDDLRQAREINPENTAEDIEQQVNQAYKNVNPFG